MGNDKKFKIDIAILTSIPIEILAALKIFNTDYENQIGFSSYIRTDDYDDYLQNGKDPNLFHFGTVTSRDQKRKYSILITKPSAYGDLRMASLVTKLDLEWSPQYYFLIGIAMSYNQSKAKLGDLVLCNRIVCQKFEAYRGKSLKPKSDLIDFCSGFHNPLLKREGVIYVTSDDDNELLERNVISGTFFSSNHLIASTEYKNEIKRNYPKESLIAGEMEAVGILSGSSESINDIKERFFLAKGISDYGDDKKKDTKWRYEAAKVSSKFISDIISEGIIEPINKNFSVDKKIFRKLDLMEFKNWLGEMQFSQGLFEKARVNLNQAWEGILREKLDTSYRNEKIARIAINKSRIELQCGRLEESLNKTMIALIISKDITETRRFDIETNRLYAEALFYAGRALREAELLKSCYDFFEKAYEVYSYSGDALGKCNTLRWVGYTKYKSGDFIAAYRDIYNSLLDYKKVTNEDDEDRLVMSETYDMLGRCLREIANINDENELTKIKIKNNPGSKTKYILRSLYYFWKGKNLAEIEGNYYRMAESYLSYVILFSYKKLNPIVTDILENKSEYIRHLNQFDYDEAIETTQFLEELSSDLSKNMKRFYDKGFSLTVKWNYKLLSCLYLKHIGDYHFHNNRQDLAIQNYNKRFEESFGSQASIDEDYENHYIVRPQEKYRSFSEINEKLLELRKATRRKYIGILNEYMTSKNIVSNNDLFSDDYFSSLL